MAYFMGILKKPKRPRAPDPDDVVGLARDILAATTLEAARAVARAFVGQNWYDNHKITEHKNENIGSLEHAERLSIVRLSAELSP